RFVYFLQPQQTSREALCVTHWKQRIGPTHHLRRTSAIARQHWHVGCHRLQQNHAERLMVGSQRKHIERFEITPPIRHLTKEAYRLCDSQLHSQSLELRFQTATAHYHQQAACW